MNNNKKYFPVYKGTLADARKELSIDLYLDSKQWNLACKTAIEYILDRNRTTNLKQAVKELLDDFGEDRVVFMIANTVQYYTYEDWFSKENENGQEESIFQKISIEESILILVTLLMEMYRF